MSFASRLRTSAGVLVLGVLAAGCSGASRTVPATPAAQTAQSGFERPAAIDRQAPARPAFIDTIPPPPPVGRAVAGSRAISSTHPTFFSGEIPLSNGVYYLVLPNSNLFGYYSYLPDPRYIFHFDLGYEYVLDANDGHGGLYMYDFASAHWWYTGTQFSFPYAYDFSLKSNIYYYADPNNSGHYSSNPRYFYNFKAGGIMTMPAGPAPLAGPLTLVGSAFGGVTAAGKSYANVVGIGAGRQASDGQADAARGSVTVTVSSGSTSSARRSVQSRFRRDAAALPVDAPTGLGRATAHEILRGPRLSGRATQTVRRPSAVVGDVKQFWAQNAAIGQGNGTYAQYPAKLVRVTPRWQIWIDTTLTSVINDSTAVNAIGSAFDNAWGSDTTHFGSSDYTNSPYWSQSAPYCNALGVQTGSGQAVITPQPLVAFIVGPNTLGAGVGGYFDEINFFPDAEVQCYASARTAGVHSNGAPMVVMGWNTAGGASYEEQEDIPRGAAHEFQHLINFVQHGIVANGSDEDAYINEGLSMLAQDLALPLMFPALSHDVDDALFHANEFLVAPEAYSLTGFSGSSTGSPTYNCTGCYGEAFVFQRYLYDHYGGDSYLHAVESGPVTGTAHVATVTGVDATTLLRDFGIALAANGKSTDARYAWSFPFGQDSTSQFGTSGHVVSTTTPVNTASGGGTFAGPYDGGYIFVQVPAGGSTVTIAETTGLSRFLGGIAQY